MHWFVRPAISGKFAAHHVPDLDIPGLYGGRQNQPFAVVPRNGHFGGCRNQSPHHHRSKAPVCLSAYRSLSQPFVVQRELSMESYEWACTLLREEPQGLPVRSGKAYDRTETFATYEIERDHLILGYAVEIAFRRHGWQFGRGWDRQWPSNLHSVGARRGPCAGRRSRAGFCPAHSRDDCR